MLGGRRDFPVRHKAELNQCLKPLQIPEHEAVPGFQKVGHGLRDPRVAEGSGDEFPGAVRFVAAGKPAGQHDDLGVPDCALHTADRIFDILRRAVPDH